jgi:rhamnogalacturonan acetylesterase
MNLNPRTRSSLPTSLLSLAVLASVVIASRAQTPAPSPTQTQGTDPTVHAKLNLPEPKNPALPTLYLVGDSTVRNGHGDGANGQWGWGEPLVDFFDPAKINVVNRAIGGRSSRTYITEGHWQEVLDRLRPGDFILIQFGHNDSGPLDDTSRARGSLPGIGEETREIENPILKRHETVHTYGWYMRQYVQQAHAKGATIVVCSLIPRKIWKDGRVVRSGADSYGGWAHQIAEQEHVPFIDLNEIIARQYDSLGEQAVEPLFADPHTHTSLEGARINAKAVITGLKLLQPDPLEKYLSPPAEAIPATMPVLKT